MHEHHKSSLLLVENQHFVWVHHISVSYTHLTLPTSDLV